MTKLRRLEGDIVFPANTPARVAARVTVELRDVSLQDQPSSVVASRIIYDIAVGPNARVPFALDAPSLPSNRSLAMRVQVDLQLNQRHAPGDYLSTVNIAVANKDDVRALSVPVAPI